jgi:hypothetical protein
MQDRLGWYHHDCNFSGNSTSYIMDAWMGSGCQKTQTQDEFTYSGRLRVNVATCGCGKDETSSVDWSGVLDSEENPMGLCLRGDPCERHVHIGDTLPTDTHQYTMGCCEIGKPCYVTVEAHVRSYNHGCCSFLS